MTLDEELQLHEHLQRWEKVHALVVESWKVNGLAFACAAFTTGLALGLEGAPPVLVIPPALIVVACAWKWRKLRQEARETARGGT
jgi:hypothetical protein